MNMSSKEITVLVMNALVLAALGVGLSLGKLDFSQFLAGAGLLLAPSAASSVAKGVFAPKEDA